MTREELVKIIEEAVESKVRKTIREEFRDILVEAVEIASRPDIKPEKRNAAQSTAMIAMPIFLFFIITPP